MADKKAVLTIDGIDKTVELPILTGTLRPWLYGYRILRIKNNIYRRR